MSSPFASPFGENSNPFGDRNAPANNLMQRVIEEEESDAVTSPTTGGFGGPAAALFSGPFGGGGDGAAETLAGSRNPPNPDGYPAQYNFSRRTSVSAESLKPSADTYDNWTPPFNKKTDEQLERLKRAIEGNFLFSHLEDEQSAQILGALNEKPIPAKGIKVGEPWNYSIGGINSVRSSSKEMLVTSSTLLRRGLLKSTSTLLGSFNLVSMVWETRSEKSRPVAHSASSRSCTTPPARRRSSRPRVDAPFGPSIV